jgi:putative transposase
MAEHQPTWPVTVLCEVLEGSRSGCEAYLPRPACAAIDAEEVVLCARVQASAADTRPSYGRRRLATQLQDEGCAVGRAQARQLLRQAGGVGQRPQQRGPVTTASHHS